MTKFFFKANDEVISHCRCKNEPAMSTGQMVSPWCGCSWLIACSKCAHAFTFAEVRETKLSMDRLARREAKTRGVEASDTELAAWGKPACSWERCPKHSTSSMWAMSSSTLTGPIGRSTAKTSRSMGTSPRTISNVYHTLKHFQIQRN